jgi:SAM-dependent methyltransferase
MCIIAQIRQAGGNLLGPHVKRHLRRLLRRNPAAQLYRSAFTGRRGLEIGGPSQIFGDDGALPIYEVLSSLDNCLYSSRTIWSGEVREGRSFQFHPAKPAGKQIICEATDLKPVENSAYECVLASHCLEHVANPLRALNEWKRVLNPAGLLLLILPHKDGTFDWKRPTTSLAHMMDDFRNGTGDDDLTHLPEILALHDMERDPAAGSKEQFRQRCLQNHSNRAIHHHVFDTASAIVLVDHAGFQIVRVETWSPLHIVILARRCEGTPGNLEFLHDRAEYHRQSSFPSDRLPSEAAAEP